jgi:hypothetical protein
VQCVVPFNFFFLELPFGLQSALVTVLAKRGVLLGSTNKKCTE